MDDSIDIVFKKAGLSANTHKAYLQSYNKLIDSGLFARRISNTENKKIIENLHQLTDNPNTFAMLLNCVILLKRHFQKNEDVLVEYRNNQSRLKIIQHHADKNVELQKGLPTYTQLLDYLDNLFKSKKYLAYIINFLLINYSVRNRDCDTVITYDINNITKDDNYIHIRKLDVVFVRNVYKTANKYKQKKHIIRSRRFYRALTELNKKEGDALILNAKNERASEEAVGGIIQSLTIERIGEGGVFKILVKNANNNIDNLMKLSKNRGTSVETILNSYRIDAV